jgi:DNA-binding CsgD family transcriptional regulator
VAKKEDNTTRVRPYRPIEANASQAIPALEIVGGAPNRIIALVPGNNLIGRSGSNHVTIDCDGVSRQHARVSLSGDAVATLVDLDSTNGTFVNGARINRMVLREGDRIQLGPDVALRFAYRTAAELAQSATKDVDEPSAEIPELSHRELEIAQLVADGLSNAQIGKRLFISPRTVGTHLSNIYKRIEVHTRAQLTRFLLEKGLFPRRTMQPPKA